jgi:hypothetical protein
VNSYRTEKEITIVCENAGVLDSFITDFNEAAGTSIATLTSNDDDDDTEG